MLEKLQGLGMTTFVHCYEFFILDTAERDLLIRNFSISFALQAQHTI